MGQQVVVPLVLLVVVPAGLVPWSQVQVVAVVSLRPAQV